MDYRDDYGRGRRYRGEGYYGGYYRHPSDREWEHREERGFMDRAGDEVRSWFGDEEAQRRRRRDERDEERGWGGSSRGWSDRERDEDVDRDWARQWGYVEGRGRGGQWQYRDRGYRDPEWSSPPQRYAGPSWTRESGYGREGWGDPSAWGPESGGSRGGEMSRGPHAGRGPRGYTRSDERIREDICDRLCEHGYIDASDVDVRVAAGEVTLQGSVRGRQEKRTAEDLVEQVSGVKQVHNELRVNDRGQESGEQPGRPFRAA